MDISIISDIDNFSVSESKSCEVEECSQYLSTFHNSLTILTQNIRSVFKNIDSFNVFLHRLNYDCDIIVLTECWLNNRYDNIPGIPGYVTHYSTINHNQNDGVIVYIREPLEVKIEEPNLKDCNGLIVKIGTNSAILALYRSPSFKNLDSFYNSLDQTLHGLRSFKNIILTGDININICPDNYEAGSQDYLNLCSYHGLLLGHSLPTHQSGSCLDHMILKSRSPSMTLVTNSTITDHRTVLLTLDITIHQQKCARTKTKLNLNKLERDLCNIDFSTVYKSADVNTSLEFVIKNVQQAILYNTTTLTLQKKYMNLKPWITPGLIRCVKHRDKLHQKARRYPDNPVIQISYKRYRNFCNDLLKKLKNAYNKNELHSAGNNSKLLWRHVKNVTYLTKKHESNSSLLTISSSPLDSVNCVNKHFANVGKSLAERISMRAYIQPISCTKSLHSFCLISTDEDEIANIILGLKDDSAPGWDNISNKILKRFRHILVPPLTYIFQQCLSKGIFPKCLKKAIVIPIYKTGNKSIIKNYRPISLLPSMSKILEKLINKRLVNFLENNKYLSPSQFGFRAKLSTSDAVHSLTDHVSEELGKGNQTLGVFLDLAKAFDTISVPILINKLEALGIRGTQLNLFKDYLDDRCQCVKIGDIVSEDQKTSGFGIPQGSILGPTLFLIYINDLCKLNISHCKIISYADDTALIFSGKSNAELYKNAQLGFNTVNNWLHCNLLTLNADKTKYIHFCMRKRNPIASNRSQLFAHRCHNPAVNTLCNNCPIISFTQNIKYLGVTLDESLSFKPHIINLTHRVRKLIYVFKKLRTIAEPKLIKLVYLALCQSIVQYCITSWGGTQKSNLLPLERAQRAILKVAYSLPFLYSTSLLYKHSNVLTVRQLFIMHTILKQHSMVPYNTYITNKRRGDIACISQSKSKFIFTNRFFSFLGPLLYNRLNKTLNIYELNYYNCKLELVKYLQLLSYDKTEDLFLICK
jgi:hypothetical protein